ncbi:FecR family protein [Pedobacter xixiisoli]|uniref:FecR family protein n=1 Tax=Pedobacter xixiisoli TaxID=1476464 RepID=A0A286A8R0_9SPHI|nr:FecR family protein [Pedobacter xixiisoli]SOD18294.1 FecR family protein [Pedobacter xixiisoli]
MKDNRILKILSRYLNHQSDSAEKVKVEAWYDHEFAKTELKIDDAKRAFLRDKMKREINREISDQKYTLKHMVLMVASVILVFLSFIFYFSVNPTIDTAKYITRKVDMGKNLIIQLNDSSLVTLNAGSEIRYPERFSKKDRRIYLISGEAFFEVKKDSKRPFIVEAGGIETKVLGTKFNVNYYSFYDKISVTVASGKVKVSKPDSLKSSGDLAVFLLPNQQAIFDKNSKLLTKREINANKIKGWMNGELYFDNEKLSHVVEVLKTRFKKDIIFDNHSIKEYRITLGFTNNDSFDGILFAIKKANNLKSLEKDGKVVLMLNQ